MKRRIVIAALLALTVCGGAIARADGDRPPGPDRDGFGPAPTEPGPGAEQGDRKAARLARTLKLTEEQQAKAKAIFQAERKKDKALRQELRAVGKQLREAGETAKFDEKAVRELAAKQGQLMTEQLVNHLRSRHEFYALLTPDQREQFEELGPPRGGHRPPPPPGARERRHCQPPPPDCGPDRFGPPPDEAGFGGPPEPDAD
ncbi:hypothetical protein GURASL_29200 [Geotalea uraniireducens]|uniref:Periplasmic heavy metal sensor n=1 Tax=Geotalea uraniireducens TaxID=351604 RepID=A0ABM8ENG0_9BACT|nr:Spy/CpxP family protein refolding chaperone [Geotalea uraniireducens]BDV43997.1 hypothetical protein GURASL_29200 [Geotalea uraniireducens]